MTKPMTDAELHARAAIALYGEKRVHVTEEGEVLVFFGHAKRFSYRTHYIDYKWSQLLTYLDACQRDLLPDLERRGKMERFGEYLKNVMLPFNGWRVNGTDITTLFKATPRQHCAAYLAAIGDQTKEGTEG